MTTKLLFFYLMSLTLSTVAAQEVLPLWPADAIPNAIASTTLTEQSTTSADGILRISNVSVPTLAVYLPPATKATGAAVMICPGGGYSILAASHEGSDVAHWLNEMGIAAFVLKYRLPNEQIMVRPYEVPLLDARQGMTLIRQNASRYGVDPNRIGVMGFSAGGHLASTLSTHPESDMAKSALSKPNFAILMYPVISFTGDKIHAGSRDKLLGTAKSPELIRQYSNELQVTAQTPPTLLVHAADDNAVPVENSLNYFLALKQAKVPAEMHVYPNGGHGFGLRVANKGSLAAWPEAAQQWLLTQVSKKP